MEKTKKYYRINYENRGFIVIDIIENDKVVGGYLIPGRSESKESIDIFMKQKGYIEYKKGVKIDG